MKDVDDDEEQNFSNNVKYQIVSSKTKLYSLLRPNMENL